MGVCVCVCVSVSVCLCLCLCVCVGKHSKIMINRTRFACPIFKQTHADRKGERAVEQFLKTPPPIPWSPPPQRQEGLSNTRSPFKWCFHRLSVSFLLSFSEALASHLDQRIYIVFSLWDVSLQQPDLHVFFDKISFLQSWNDAMACARHTVSLQGPTWNLKVTCSECEFAAWEAFSWTAAFRAPHLRSSLWRYHHSDVSNHGRVNGEQST